MPGVDGPISTEGSGERVDVPLSSLWPDHPVGEGAVWAAMSRTNREKAAVRLRAVMEHEASAGGRAAADYVRELGIGKTRWGTMLAAWRRERSLLSLVPQARGRASRRIEGSEELKEAARIAVRAAVRDGAFSRERIAASLFERYGRPSLSWMRRLVASAERDLERASAGGRSGFGRRIVVDSAALPLPLLVEPSSGRSEEERSERGEECDEVEWAVAAFVYDAATNFVVGHALNRAPSDVLLQAAAAADASDRLRGMGQAGRADVEPEISMVLPLGDRTSMDILRILRSLREAGAEVVLGYPGAGEPEGGGRRDGADGLAMRVAQGLHAADVEPIHSARAAGGELMRAFDGRMGMLELKPRFAAKTFEGRTDRASALERSGRVPMDLDDARLILDREISAHNARVEDFSPAVRPSVVADLLDRIFHSHSDGRELAV